VRSNVFFIFSALYEQTGKAMKTKTSATQVHSNCLQCFQLKLRRWLRAETDLIFQDDVCFYSLFAWRFLLLSDQNEKIGDVDCASRVQSINRKDARRLDCDDGLGCGRAERRATRGNLWMQKFSSSVKDKLSLSQCFWCKTWA